MNNKIDISKPELTDIRKKEEENVYVKNNKKIKNKENERENEVKENKDNDENLKNKQENNQNDLENNNVPESNISPQEPLYKTEKQKDGTFHYGMLAYALIMICPFGGAFAFILVPAQAGSILLVPYSKDFEKEVKIPLEISNGDGLLTDDDKDKLYSGIDEEKNKSTLEDISKKNPETFKKNINSTLDKISLGNPKLKEIIENSKDNIKIVTDEKEIQNVLNNINKNSYPTLDNISINNNQNNKSTLNNVSIKNNISKLSNISSKIEKNNNSTLTNISVSKNQNRTLL